MTNDPLKLTLGWKKKEKNCFNLLIYGYNMTSDIVMVKDHRYERKAASTNHSMGYFYRKQ
jgi:hypothetical protein